MESFIKDYGALIQGVADPHQFAASLQNAKKFGINTNGSKVSTYVSDLAGTAKHIGDFISRTQK